jgi:hypothetical protein
VKNFKDYIKAVRRGSREAFLENSTGFISVNKLHKSKKTYTRKLKHKKK